MTLHCAISAQAQDPPANQAPVIQFVGPPTKESQPALRYRLLPPFLDLKPGNAALVYNKITMEFSTRRSPEASERDIRISSEWLDTPIDKLPRDKVEADLAPYRFALNEADRAARMETCDWQLALRNEEPWNVLLPEVQGMRSIARVLAAKARLQIHDLKYDEAVHTLQTGFAMARQVAEGPTLVNALVGAAIAGLMLDQVEALMRAPNAPNMYWALMALPRPLIDMRLGLSAELNFVDFAFPGVQDLHGADYTPDEWRKLVHKIDGTINQFTGSPVTPEASQLLSTMLAVKTYPAARQSLMKLGHSVEDVDAMPVPKVVAIYKLDAFYRLRDNVFKWMYLPFWQQNPGAMEAEMAVTRSRDTLEGFPLTELLPGIHSASFASARLDRRIAVLAAVNALRMHAAANGGKLPSTLEEIQLAPVLTDPVTGRPFSYSIDGAKATITSPAPLKMESSNAALHYEVTITP